MDAGSVKQRVDHLWLVSVLNDPERFPELSVLSYGRANPVTFNAKNLSHNNARLPDSSIVTPINCAGFGDHHR